MTKKQKKEKINMYRRLSSDSSLQKGLNFLFFQKRHSSAFSSSTFFSDDLKQDLRGLIFFLLIATPITSAYDLVPQLTPDLGDLLKNKFGLLTFRVLIIPNNKIWFIILFKSMNLQEISKEEPNLGHLCTVKIVLDDFYHYSAKYCTVINYWLPGFKVERNTVKKIFREGV